MLSNNEKPCLVEVKQGFSILYKEKYLYSKYNPEKNISCLIDDLLIKEYTLVLLCSPILSYGIEKLIQKLPQKSVIVGIEFDKNLFEIGKKYLAPLQEKFSKQFIYLYYENPYRFIKELHEPSNTKFFISSFKYVKKIDASGGTQFYKDFYTTTLDLTQNAISQFWKNRITIQYLGKLYAKNIFKNMPFVYKSELVQEKTIESNILVLGGGGSVDAIIPILKKVQNNFFIIAVDSVASTLIKNHIQIDVLIAVESQLANEQAFVGNCSQIPLLFADLTSRTNIIKHCNHYSFFLSEYTQCNYLTRIEEKVGIPKIPPLGSVGLTAVYIAIALRKNTSIPIYICGLDFSFTLGKTHCKEAPSQRRILDKHTKLQGIESISFSKSQFSCENALKKKIYTDIPLNSYCQNFIQQFTNEKNLFTLTQEGIDLSLPYKTLSDIAYKQEKKLSNKTTPFFRKNSVYDYLCQEKEKLESIKKMLTKEIPVANLQELLTECDYLFLHFPDGYEGAKDSIPFLKRVRAEIDYFLKIINLSLSKINE